MKKIKSFVNKYNWEGINFPSNQNHWKRFKENSRTITLNVLYTKKEKIYPANVSKHNLNHQKTNSYFNGSKEKTLILSDSKKSISIIKNNNV